MAQLDVNLIGTPPAASDRPWDRYEAIGLVADLMPVALVIADARGDVRFVNSRWRDLTGQHDRSWAGHGWLDALDVRDRAETLLAITERRFHCADWSVRSGSGERRLLRASLAPDLDDAGCTRRFVVTAIDVTDDVARTEQLMHRATHDSLTGLANRQVFIDFVAHALDRLRRAPGRHAGVVFVDVVDLKRTNDRFGHHVGDEVLQAVAACLRSAVRPADVVARYGGDEFTVLCEDLRDPAEALAVAHRIAYAAHRQGRLGLSIGVAVVDDADGPESVIRAADDAMYLAKELRVPTPILHCSSGV